MDIGFGYQILLVVLILGLNGFFAAAETALISVRPSRLKELADKGELGAHAALSLLVNPERMLSVGQVGLTLTSLILGYLGEKVFVEWMTEGMYAALPWATKAVLHGISFSIAFLLMTFMHVVVGEVVPKNLAIDKADRMAVLVSPPLLIFYKVALPFVYIIERSSAILSRWLGIRETPMSGAHSVEELKFIVSASHTSGHINEFQRSAIQNLIALEEYSVREVMTPRNTLVTVPSTVRVDQLSSFFNESHFSRLPVYEGKPENLVGIIHVKDVLDYLVQFRRSVLRGRPARSFDLEKVIRKIPLVPETKHLSDVLDTLREERAHVAFVVDEYGTLIGMVSMEDIMEHVFGEIEDEYDTSDAVRALTSGEVEVDGTTSLVDLDVQYGIPLPDDLGVETLAGFLMHELQRVPSPGDSVMLGEWRFTVTSMTHNRVNTVRVERVPATASAPANVSKD